MAANRWQYFRWTGRTALISFVYMVAVPSLVGYIGWRTDVSGWTFRFHLHVVWRIEVVGRAVVMNGLRGGSFVR